MAYFLFIGDMLIMAFMIVLVVWVSMKSSNKSIDKASRIPLEDEEYDG